MTVKFLHDPPRVSLYKSAAQSCANDAGLAFGTSVTWDTEAYDDFAMHGASSSQMFAPVTGLYCLQASIWFAGNATGVRYIKADINDTTDVAYDRILATGGTANINCHISVDVQLTEGDFVKIKATQNSGVALNLIAGFGLCTAQLRWVAQS